MIPVAKPFLTQDEAHAAAAVIISGWVTQGPKVEEFEKKFAAYVGAKYAVAVSSCTTALHLALIVAGVGKNDEVICPSLSFIATANAVLYTGAKPVFCDVEKDSYNISPCDAEKLITKKTKAILIVHQMGMPADINEFKKICRKHKLELIEDAACAIGSEYHGKKIGSHAELVCFSFHPRKVMTTGDGGMITTSNQKYYERLKRLRQHGMTISDRVRHGSKKVLAERYDEIGYNYRMTDIQAAIGIEQLKKVTWLISERRKLAAIYNQYLINIPGIRLPVEQPGIRTNYQSFSIYLTKSSWRARDILMQKLLNHGISTRRGIMLAHEEKSYRQMYPKLKLPVSEDLSHHSMILPLYVTLPKKEIIAIIDLLKKYL